MVSPIDGLDSEELVDGRHGHYEAEGSQVSLVQMEEGYRGGRETVQLGLNEHSIIYSTLEHQQ